MEYMGDAPHPRREDGLIGEGSFYNFNWQAGEMGEVVLRTGQNAHQFSARGQHLGQTAS